MSKRQLGKEMDRGSSCSGVSIVVDGVRRSPGNGATQRLSGPDSLGRVRQPVVWVDVFRTLFSDSGHREGFGLI